MLRDVSPLVWRRLLISSETSLAQFHELLLLAFAWSGEHLHLFHIHGGDYGVSQYGGNVFGDDALQVRLSRFGSMMASGSGVNTTLGPVGSRIAQNAMISKSPVQITYKDFPEL